MGKPKAPPPPDYAAAAREQGAANLQSGLQTTSLGNPNVTNPYGSQTVTYQQTGPNGGWQPYINQSLTPQAQATLDAQQRVQTGMAQLGEKGLAQAQDQLGRPFNYDGPEIQTNFGGYGQAGGYSGYGQASGSLGDYGRANGELGDYGNVLQNLDLSGIANLPVNAGMTGQQAIMSRLQPQLEASDAAFRQQMANQGITAGGEAFDAAQRNQYQSTNDARNQAALYGLGLDFQANQQGMQNALATGNFSNAAQQQRYAQALGANQVANSAQQQNYNQALGAGQFSNQAQQQNYEQGLQAQGLYNQAQAQNYNQALGQAQFGNTAALQRYQQQLAQYNQPLNQTTALMSGSQIQAPQFQQYQGANISAAPVFQGAQAQGTYNQGIYGQQMAGYNAMLGGVADLGGAAMTAGMFSDMRLKSNIVKVGEHPRGFGIYEYDIFGRRERGVMAQEVEKVLPAAVTTHPSGYKMVYYGML